MISKIDNNHTEIVKALIGIGASVHSTATMHHGFPDIVVGFLGKNFLFEIKSKKAKLTPDEVRFQETWKGDYRVVRTVDEALKIVGVQ